MWYSNSVTLDGFDLQSSYPPSTAMSILEYNAFGVFNDSDTDTAESTEPFAYIKHPLTAADYTSPSEVSSLDSMLITLGGLPEITAESDDVEMYVKAQYYNGDGGSNYTITESGGSDTVTGNVVTKKCLRTQCDTISDR